MHNSVGREVGRGSVDGEYLILARGLSELTLVGDAGFGGIAFPAPKRLRWSQDRVRASNPRCLRHERIVR